MTRNNHASILYSSRDLVLLEFHRLWQFSGLGLGLLLTSVLGGTDEALKNHVQL